MAKKEFLDNAVLPDYIFSQTFLLTKTNAVTLVMKVEHATMMLATVIWDESCNIAIVIATKR